MSKKAMNLNKRVKQVVKDDKALVAWFRNHGFFALVGYWVCDACAEEMMMGAQSVGYTGIDIPPWGNAKCALKFKKDGATIAACRCGWRKEITIKFTPKDKPHCTNKTCNSTLSEKEIKDNNGYCWKCKPYDPIAAAMVPHVKPIKVCKGKNGNNCANPLPPGRGAWCYTCHPKTSTDINM